MLEFSCRNFMWFSQKEIAFWNEMENFKIFGLFDSAALAGEVVKYNYLPLMFLHLIFRYTFRFFFRPLGATSTSKRTNKRNNLKIWNLNKQNEALFVQPHPPFGHSLSHTLFLPTKHTWSVFCYQWIKVLFCVLILTMYYPIV